jgi:outer membrane protein insertion porin family
MHMRLSALPALLLVLAGASRLHAQDPVQPRVDSVAVEGNVRVTSAQVVTSAGLVVGMPINYRDIQRAVSALYRTGQFDDVTVSQRFVAGRSIVLFSVRERPLLASWAVSGASRVSPGDVRERVKLVEGRPIDRSAVARAEAAIDSLYRDRGYYAANVTTVELPADSAGGLRVVFNVQEGSRIAISQVTIDGNARFSDAQVVGQMASRPEAFWWFRDGEYDEMKVEEDSRERLPRWYGSRGNIDFQVLGDTLIADSTEGKATLQLTVDEGPVYKVGKFEVKGNRRYSSDELTAYYPFLGTAEASADFDRSAWEAATGRIGDLYANTGYIYAQVVPQETRRTLPDSTRVVDLAWNIQEGQVATINKINIVGNDVTHERVIREAIIMLPGQVFSRDALVRSYQNVGNLGFFQQPMAPPSVEPAENRVDVDITFRVEERRTGNINFGASLGQGTGVGGFLGLEEPNLFGRGKRGRLQWQFGTNINDFTLSYTDPAIKESRISGTVSVYDSRQKYIVQDLGRRRQTGGSLQLGFPFLGSRFTRVFASYGLQRVRYSEGSEEIQERFICNNCTRSTLGSSLVRDTRIGLPFATGGSQTSISGELNGGFLGGTGNYQKVDVEGRWYAPLGTLGGGGQFGGGIQFVLGLTAKSGFIFGNASNFFTELFSLGGVQYGIPLRGYEEFAITPNGFDPQAGGSRANPEAFGKAFSAFSVEAGARISQSLYVNTFMDAGNVYRTARQWDPTRLFRGAGFGVALVSPLGPIGVDLAYGFDKKDADGNPTPGWQLHFKVGNFF